MACLFMVLTFSGVQAVSGHNEGAVSGAYTLMALSKVVANVASNLNFQKIVKPIWKNGLCAKKVVGL